MSAHTPGPWKAGGLGYVLDEHSDTIAVSCGNKPISEQEANVQLIAAAPELLAALRGLMVLVDGEDDQAIEDEGMRYINARAAIAKAGGRE